ncbi:MAG: glycosyltransferase family 2 protein, partial [Ilumatobacteraceae bacterium]
MTRKDELVEQLRKLKVRLTIGGVLARLMVPLVEVCEFSLSHGFREVVIRTRLRLGGPTTTTTPLLYAIPRDDGKPFAALSIPPAHDRVSTSIVIPVLNNAAFTHRCLRSIIEQTASGSYEVIVVDNGSDDRSRQMLSRIDGPRLIRNDANVGFVGACNQGAGAARGDFVLFLNNDTIVVSGWLDALLRTFERDSSVGAVGAKLIYPDGRLQEAGGIIWRDGAGWNYGRHGESDAPEFNYLREVDYCSGACLLVRRSLFEMLGGFDNRYAPAYYEDTDLCFRLRE